MYAISIGHIYLLVGQWKMSFSVDFIQLLLVTFRGNLNGTKECLTVPEVSLLQKRLWVWRTIAVTNDNELDSAFLGALIKCFWKSTCKHHRENVPIFWQLFNPINHRSCHSGCLCLFIAVLLSSAWSWSKWPFSNYSNDAGSFGRRAPIYGPNALNEGNFFFNNHWRKTTQCSPNGFLLLIVTS